MSTYNYREMLDAVYERIDYVSAISQCFDDLSTTLPLDGVQSCVAIGCGNGNTEVPFVKHCMPNVTEFVGVEPDTASIGELRQKLSEQLPNIRSVFYQEEIQNWQGLDKPADSVFLFHFLYYLNPQERAALTRKLFEGVLHSGSYVFVVIHPHHTFGEPSHYFRLVQLVEGASGKSVEVPTDANVREMMAAAGYQLCFERMSESRLLVENLDDATLSLVLSPYKGWNLEAARRAAKEVFGDASRVPHHVWLGVFKKP